MGMPSAVNVSTRSLSVGVKVPEFSISNCNHCPININVYNNCSGQCNSVSK